MVKSLNLVIVTETFPPEVNGVAMTWGCLTRELLRMGHRLLVVRPRQGKDDMPKVEGGSQEFLVRGIPLPGYPELKLGLPGGRRLGRVLEEFGPSLVHIVTEGPLGWSALRQAKKRGIPVSSSFHTNFHTYSSHYGVGVFRKLGFAYLRAFHNRTLATFAPTTEMMGILEGDGMKRLRLLGRGVDTSLFSPNRRSAGLREFWGLSPEDRAVVYVGRLAAEKNIPLAVRSFEAIRARLPKARFVLVGDGPLRPKLEREHPEFIFAGMRRGEDLAEHYASADLFLAPSLTETFGNVVTEAMASGLPVLTFDYAAGRQHLHDGENGFLAPFGDEEAYLSRAGVLASRVENWTKVGARAAATMREQTWEKVAARFGADLQSMVRQGEVREVVERSPQS